MVLSHEKPSSISALVGNPSAFLAAREWAKLWQAGKKQEPLLVYGPTGTGKTALAHAIASEFGWEIFEFNASELRDEEAVERLLANATASSSLTGARRLILIDDADSLSGSADRGGAAAIARALASSRQPAIVTALSLYDKKLQTIRAHCAPLELRRVQSTTIAGLLKKIAASKKIPLRPEEIEKIAQSASGDVRAALNDLQGRNTTALRDSEKNVFEVVRAILKSQKYSESRAAAFASETEHDTLKLWIAQNIPAEYEKPYDIAEAYNALSRADVFDGRISRAQYWGYLRYSGDLMSSGVALAKTEPYRKYTQYSYPDYIREMGASKSARATRKSALSKIAACCHCSLAQASSYLPLLELLAKEDAQEVAKEFGFEEDETEFVAKKGSKKKPAASKQKRRA